MMMMMMPVVVVMVETWAFLQKHTHKRYTYSLVYLYISYIGTALAVSFPSCNSNYPGRSYFNNPWRSQLLHSWSIRYALNDSFPRSVAWENTLKDNKKHGWHPKSVPGIERSLKFIAYWPRSDSIMTSSIPDYLPCQAAELVSVAQWSLKASKPFQAGHWGYYLWIFRQRVSRLLYAVIFHSK